MASSAATWHVLELPFRTTGVRERKWLKRGDGGGRVVAAYRVGCLFAGWRRASICTPDCVDWISIRPTETAVSVRS